jgi:hypothetical protein
MIASALVPAASTSIFPYHHPERRRDLLRGKPQVCSSARARNPDFMLIV